MAGALLQARMRLEQAGTQLRLERQAFERQKVRIWQGPLPLYYKVRPLSSKNRTPSNDA